MKRLPRALHLLAAAAAGLALSCASTPTLPAKDRAVREEVRDLRRMVVELQRKAAVSEVELARLREKVAQLESAPPSGVAVREPAVEAAPRRPAPREVVIPSPPPVRPIEEADLEDDLDDPEVLPEPAPPVAEPSRAAAPPELEPVDASAQALYDRGYTLYNQGEYVEAEASFQRFLSAHPETDLSDNALYWIGESRYARRDLRGALSAFRESVHRFPRGNKVPDALLKAGQCLEELGDAASARASYREIERRFPDSAAALIAAERIRSLDA